MTKDEGRLTDEELGKIKAWTYFCDGGNAVRYPIQALQDGLRYIRRLLAALEASEAEVEGRNVYIAQLRDQLGELRAIADGYKIEAEIDRAEVTTLIKKEYNARRCAATWKAAAKKLWLEDRFWDKHKAASAVKERDELRAEVERLRMEMEALRGD